MSHEGVIVLQRMKNLEYIQEIDGSWYYLDEVLKYSKPFSKYEDAKKGLLKYFEEYNNEMELKTTM